MCLNIHGEKTTTTKKFSNDNRVCERERERERKIHTPKGQTRNKNKKKTILWQYKHSDLFYSLSSQITDHITNRIPSHIQQQQVFFLHHSNSFFVFYYYYHYHHTLVVIITFVGRGGSFE